MLALCRPCRYPFMTIPRPAARPGKLEFLHLLAFHCAGIEYLFAYSYDDLICALSHFVSVMGWWCSALSPGFLFVLDWLFISFHCAWGAWSLALIPFLTFSFAFFCDWRRTLLFVFFSSDRNFISLHPWIYLRLERFPATLGNMRYTLCSSHVYCQYGIADGKKALARPDLLWVHLGLEELRWGVFHGYWMGWAAVMSVKVLRFKHGFLFFC